MKISIEKLPPKGIMLLYFNDKTVFFPYETKDGKLISSEEPKGTPTECHFFDESREYRIIRRESDNSYIETILSAEEEKDADPDLIYEEYPLVKEEYAKKDGIPEKLLIVSRYKYTDNDILELASYRIGLPRMF
ncbi:MAG: hypothetical protein J6I62_05125 [Selenomonadaceae bacterium]|nr:hypothetical protein [Selenomonadaceae bacterium]